MANIIGTLASVPNGLWEKIIFAFNDTFKNYALAIILLTICIKFLTLPIDFINRRSTQKMTEVQGKLQKQIADIKKRYPDPMTQNQKLSELYKKEGFNPMGSCLNMILVLVISWGVFFTLFMSLNSMAAYKIVSQYEDLRSAYIQEYVKEDRGITQEEYEALELTEDEIGNYIITISTSGTDEEIANRTEIANQSVIEKYAEVRESFLWIKNVWMTDSLTQRAIPSFDSYYKLAKLKLPQEEYEVQKVQYNTVMAKLEETQGVNGYYLLAVLAAVSAFLYQYLLTNNKKKKDEYKQKQTQQDAAQSSGKAMMIILPVIMLIFTLSYNSVFALYIVTSQLFGMATAPLIKYLIKITNKEKKNNYSITK